MTSRWQDSTASLEMVMCCQGTSTRRTGRRAIGRLKRMRTMRSRRRMVREVRAEMEKLGKIANDSGAARHVQEAAYAAAQALGWSLGLDYAPASKVVMPPG